MDADAHRDLAARFDVTGFPSLLWFPGGGAGLEAAPEDVSGTRSPEVLSLPSAPSSPLEPASPRSDEGERLAPHVRAKLLADLAGLDWGLRK